MTQDRRKDDRHPDRPLDWTDTETLAGQDWKAPAAAPAAGQAGLAKPECWTDDVACRKCGMMGWHVCRAPVAADTEQATDWICALDEAPVQGEGVLVTDGETVTAARWFSTGWAEHGFDNDEVKYLPEGRVTHWKPLYAAPAAPAAPLATPADAGTGPDAQGDGHE